MLNKIPFPVGGKLYKSDFTANLIVTINPSEGRILRNFIESSEAPNNQKPINQEPINQEPVNQRLKIKDKKRI